MTWRYPPPTTRQGVEEVIPGQVEPWGVLEERGGWVFFRRETMVPASFFVSDILLVFLILVKGILNQLLDKRSFDLKAASKINEKS